MITISLFRTNEKTGDDTFIGYADVEVDNTESLPGVVSVKQPILGSSEFQRVIYVQDLRIARKVYIEKTFDLAINFRKEN